MLRQLVNSRTSLAHACVSLVPLAVLVAACSSSSPPNRGFHYEAVSMDTPSAGAAEPEGDGTPPVSAKDFQQVHDDLAAEFKRYDDIEARYNDLGDTGFGSHFRGSRSLGYLGGSALSTAGVLASIFPLTAVGTGLAAWAIYKDDFGHSAGHYHSAAAMLGCVRSRSSELERVDVAALAKDGRDRADDDLRLYRQAAAYLKGTRTAIVTWAENADAVGGPTFPDIDIGADSLPGTDESGKPASVAVGAILGHSANCVLGGETAGG